MLLGIQAFPLGVRQKEGDGSHNFPRLATPCWPPFPSFMLFSKSSRSCLEVVDRQMLKYSWLPSVTSRAILFFMIYQTGVWEAFGGL